jgi:hypothetical protein
MTLSYTQRNCPCKQSGYIGVSYKAIPRSLRTTVLTRTQNKPSQEKHCNKEACEVDSSAHSYKTFKIYSRSKITNVNQQTKSQSIIVFTVVKKKEKVKLCNRPWKSMGLIDVEAPTFSLENRLTNGGEVVSLIRRPLFIPRKISGTHFC